MDSWKHLIDRVVTFSVPTVVAGGMSRAGKPGAAQLQRLELTGVVLSEKPENRLVKIQGKIGDEKIEVDFRYEDVTVLAIDGVPFQPTNPAHIGTPLAPDAPPIERWNPVTKTVMNHESGKVNEEETNKEREARGLPTPWKKTMLKEEAQEPPVP